LQSATGQPGAISASWKAPSSLGDQPLTFYTATANPGANYCTTTALTCTITGLQNGTTYSVTATATTSAGYSPNSNALSATPVSTPQSPTAVTAKAGDTKASVTWVASTDTGGLPLTGFSIIAQTFPVATTQYHFTAPANASSYTVTGLQDGTQYCIKVSAVNALGASESSDSCVTPEVLPGAPSAPTATPGTQSAIISWSAAAQRTGGAPILGYTATATPGGQSCTTSSLSCTITGLFSGVSYSVAVTAYSGYGTSEPSAAVSVTPIGPPASPATVTATPLNNALLASWSSTKAVSYTATATDGTNSFSCTTTATNCVVTGLQNGTAYAVTVTAMNLQGSSAPSLPSMATPAAVFTWTLSALPTALVGAKTPVTLHLNPGLPAATLPAAGATVTLLVNAVPYSAQLSADGTAVFSPTINAGSNLLGVTLAAGVAAAAPSSTLRITGLYGFGGFAPSTLSVGSSSIWFSLKDANGPLPHLAAASLAASNRVGLQFSGSGPTRVQSCTYASGNFTCPNSVPFGSRTLTAVQLVDGVWTQVATLQGLLPKYQYGSYMAPGHVFAVGQDLVSASGTYHAFLTGSGIFVVTGPHGVIWRSSNHATTARRAWFQSSGRFVLTTASGQVVFASRGAGNRIVLQGDGNLVLYNGAKPTWSTR
jgi:fibronectin type 3 domain-containing protein